MHATLPLLEVTDFPLIDRARLDTVQVNLGYRCNQQCLHCHVNASPKRKEMMTRETVDQVLDYLRASGAKSLDLTGGAPELNMNFRYLVQQARALEVQVIDRCNLTVLFEPGQSDLAEFLAQHDVEITASLPCYLEDNVNQQRGSGVFKSSILALRKLNALGYGQAGNPLTLNLVYNPQGATLPPDQVGLEQDYKKQLGAQHGIVFNHLYALANMPIQRFGSTLISHGGFQDYMALLRSAHNPAALNNVMCRSLISVDWRGYVYDCDFNQMLGVSLGAVQSPRIHIKKLAEVNLSNKPIAIRDHCYGCTAGQGSSCGGALL